MTIRRIFSSYIPIIIALTCFAAAGCSTQKTRKHGWLCREHGTHLATVKADFLACFQIGQSDTDSCYIFEKESSVTNGKDLDSTSAILKEKVADEIVDLIMKRLEAAYGSELTAHWRLESIDIGVPFRTFVLAEGPSLRVKVIALLKKDDLSPRSLLRFLPLEYKMNLVEPTSREKREFRNQPIP